MSEKSKIIAVPSEIDPADNFLAEYWATELGITKKRLLQACAKVGHSVGDIKKHVSNGITVAIRDDNGKLRRVVKVMPMTDGFAVSVPYHSARQGWLFKHSVDYRGTFGVAEINESDHFTAEDRVKLSMHLDGGFVQFSRGGAGQIISGRDKATGEIKGLGVASPYPIEVRSGPLFGVQLQNIDEFEALGERVAETFSNEDCYIHPRLTHADSEAYHLEFFMLPRDWLSRAELIGDRLMLVRELPFISMFTFPFHIRVIEFPRLKWVIGVLVHRMDRHGEGYCLSGPSCGPPGKPMALGAWYPRPDLIKNVKATRSLDYPQAT